MLVELDLLEAKRLKLTINQFLLIRLVIDKINIAPIKETLNISGSDIDKLISLNIFTKDSLFTPTLSRLKLTPEMEKAIGTKDFFSEFYDSYPVYSIRTDGSRDYLRSDVNRARVVYNKLVGKSETKHNEVMTALKAELAEKRASNKMSYMKRMYKWLTSEEYLVYLEKSKAIIYSDEPKTISYGTEVV
jgi:hypothetical protein